MVGLVIAFPEIVSSGLRREQAVDPARLERSLKELDAPTLPEALSDPLRSGLRRCGAADRGAAGRPR